MHTLKSWLLRTTRIPRDLAPRKPLWAIRGLWQSKWEKAATFEQVLRAAVNTPWQYSKES